MGVLDAGPSKCAVSESKPGGFGAEPPHTESESALLLLVLSGLISTPCLNSALSLWSFHIFPSLLLASHYLRVAQA